MGRGNLAFYIFPLYPPPARKVRLPSSENPLPRPQKNGDREGISQSQMIFRLKRIGGEAVWLLAGDSSVRGCWRGRCFIDTEGVNWGVVGATRWGWLW